MKTYITEERLKENEYKVAMFKQKQALPYEIKVKHAEIRAREFYEDPRVDGNAFVSVGGLDSITLFMFLKSIGLDVPGVSVSALEDKSIQSVHKKIGVERLRPMMNKVEVIRRFGYPILSKEIAGKIWLLQNPTEKNSTVRHAIITGETGEYGGYRKNTRMKMSQKWLEKFGGADPEGLALGYDTAPFAVSDKCCYWLKELPCNNYARQTGRHPYMGLLASEGGRRQKALMINGCNYFGKSTIRSCPFAIFTRQDLLQLALDLRVPVPEIYGEIRRKDDGTLYTTGATRTGCSMCGFGIHLEKRPHRFDALRERNEKEWKFWMYDMGWGNVLDYIGVQWEDLYEKQRTLFDQSEESPYEKKEEL